MHCIGLTIREVSERSVIVYKPARVYSGVLGVSDAFPSRLILRNFVRVGPHPLCFRDKTL